MSSRSRSTGMFRPSLSFILLAALLVVLLLAGGASRGDALGQMVVRACAWTALIVLVLFGARPVVGEGRPVLLLLAAALLVAILQLVPLPPNLWSALPGRAPFLDAAALSGQPQPWRPWSIVPGATINAAFSLVVPFAVLVLAVGLTERDRSWLPGFLLGMVTVGALVGLLQFSGASFNNPLINDAAGEVAGTFANRNHFAVFLAMGCLLAPVWAFLDGRQPQWRAPVALGLVILFVLTILASGSRAGFLTGALALLLGLAIVRQGIRRALAGYPGWVPLALLVGILVLVGAFVALSVLAGRAVSIDRLVTMDQGQDMRARGLPVVVAMVGEYFPLGAGLGAFDAVFRMHEPFALLKPTYFNHAHNDFLEVVLDAGLPGAVLLAVALGWWVWATVRAWRVGASVRYALPKLGSAMLLLIIVASAFDYPARTPLVMAVMAIAGLWLSQRPVVHRAPSGGSALPTRDQQL